MICAAISWYYAGLVITLNLRITASDYVDILGNQLQSYGNMIFSNNDAIFHDDSSPIHTHTRVFSLGLRSMKMHFNIFPGQHNRQT
jgi:hypothetical protein